MPFFWLCEIRNDISKMKCLPCKIVLSNFISYFIISITWTKYLYDCTIKYAKKGIIFYYIWKHITQHNTNPVLPTNHACAQPFHPVNRPYSRLPPCWFSYCYANCQLAMCYAVGSNIEKMQIAENRLNEILK